MAFALITDIHANREAYEACLAHAGRQGISQFVFLGDFVGYGADPVWVVDQIIEQRRRGAVAVRGNHDASAGGTLRERLHPDAEASLRWTRAQLRPDQQEFLRSLPLTADDGPCLFVHANGFAPQNFEYILGSHEAGRSMRVASARITFCGHVHEPMLYHMGLTQRVESFRPVPGSPIPLSASRRWLALPGSAGQPRDGDPAACYASFDELTNMLTFWRVPYDHETAARKVRAAGLGERLAHQLLHGA